MVLFVIWAAARPAWIGLSLGLDDTGQIVVTQAEGPSAGIPLGTSLASVAGGGDEMLLEPLDLTIEPDGTIDDYDVYAEFLHRAGRLDHIQSADTVTFTSTDGRIFTVTPRLDDRPLTTLPVAFWVPLFVGIIAWLVSSAVFAFRPMEASARYLLLSGGATLVFAPFSAAYATRELGFPTTLFQWLSDLNFLGGSIFIASLIALLLYYPKRLAPDWVGLAVVALYTAWFIAQQIGWFESMIFARRFLVGIGLLTTFVLAGVHWYLTRKDPVARAALQWFLLSSMVGTTLFWLFILLPQSFGVDTTPFKGYGFVLFLFVYGGLAFGILRYRLFDLGEWWGRIVLWTLSIFLLIVLDLVFLMLLQLSNSMSLGLALLVTGLIWLPVRALVWGRFIDRNEVPRGTLFRQIMDVALTPPGDNQSARWYQVLKSVFDPLAIHPDANVAKATLSPDGLSLHVPAIDAVPALRLDYAHGGRSLFSPRDVAVVEEISAMLSHAIESRSAYEKGVSEERTRIARDMHDNIGAQLLGALHSQDAEHKDTMIRETFADIRQILNDTLSPDQSLGELIAELRQESHDRLTLAGLRLDWVSEADPAASPNPAAAHALRSVVREAVSNTIKHARAARMRVSLCCDGKTMALIVEDDGIGFDPNAPSSSNGLGSMKGRVEELKGRFRLSRLQRGMRLEAEFPA